MEEIDGVVSSRSLQMLVQWVCLGRIIFDESLSDEGITSVIKFARFADMCAVTSVLKKTLPKKPKVRANAVVSAKVLRQRQMKLLR